MLKPFMFAASLMITCAACAEEPTRILFLSKSAGFEHSTIKQENGEPSHTDKVLTELAEKMGASITATKDASYIHADKLKDFDVVIFFTTGDLTTPGTDGATPMGPEGVGALLTWITEGGGFMGFHCATDTFHADPQCSSPTPYTELIGGEFQSHGPQFEGTIKVVDTAHPTMAAVPQNWKVNDEWYLFCNLNEQMHVLALLDTTQMEKKIKMYDRPPYPVIWCSTLGKGRVFYNAMGHREDVWDNSSFREHVTSVVKWVNGEGEAGADPNFSQVVPQKEEEAEQPAE